MDIPEHGLEELIAIFGVIILWIAVRACERQEGQHEKNDK